MEADGEISPTLGIPADRLRGKRQILRLSARFHEEKGRTGGWPPRVEHGGIEVIRDDRAVFFAPNKSASELARLQRGTELLPPLTAAVSSQTPRPQFRKSPTGLRSLKTRWSRGRESKGGIL
jgi:hypothetical protein